MGLRAAGDRRAAEQQEDDEQPRADRDARDLAGAGTRVVVALGGAPAERRGDDVDAIGLDDRWWVSIAAQPFASQAEAAAWCTTNAVPGCTPLQVGG